VNQWLENWLAGCNILFYDDCITFYVYFSALLAEIACLWVFFPEIALPFTCLNALCILNVLVCSYGKGFCEGYKPELIFARAYLITFAAIFIIGFFFSWKANLILFLVPFVAIGVFSVIRTFTNTVFIGKWPKKIVILQKIFKNKVICGLGMFAGVYTPFWVFSWFLFQTSLPNVLKLLISVVYGLLIPMICYIEDDFSALTIFEIGFDITWSEEYEQKQKEFEERYNENPEELKEEVIRQAEAMMEGLKNAIEQAVREEENK